MAGANGYAKRRAVLRTRRASAAAASSMTSRRADARGGTGNALQVLGEELHGARAGQRRAGLVIAPPRIAVESVARRVDMHRHRGMGGANLRMVIGWDGLVRLAEVEEDRGTRLLRRRLRHPAAVVGHGAAHAVDPRRGQPGEGAAQTIADHAHLQTLGLEGAHGGADILDHVVDVDLAAHGAATVAVLGRVARLEAALGAIEDGGGEGDVAVGRESVRDLLDMRVDAEDLLDDDDAGFGLAGRGDPVGAERVAIFGGERDHLTPAGILRGRAGQPALGWENVEAAILPQPRLFVRGTLGP